MKKLLLYGVALVCVYFAYLAFTLYRLPPVSSLKDRKTSRTIQVKDWHGEYHPLVVGPKGKYWTPSRSIPPEMKWAVILAEDASFYRHDGIDVKAIKNAIKYDLERKSFARGASTITQQTAKNLFLTRQKTLTRKVQELYLAKRMERELTKGRIIELYLNVIELGPMVYGIGHGSRYYFGKPPQALTPRECAFLAAMLPGPRVAYNPYKNLNKVLKRSNMILRLLRDKGVLSGDEYRVALAQVPNVGRLQRRVEETIKKVEVFGNLSSAALPEEPQPEDAAPEEWAPEEGAPDAQVEEASAEQPTEAQQSPESWVPSGGGEGSAQP